MKLKTKIGAIALLVILLVGGYYYWSLEQKLNKRFSDGIYLDDKETKFPSVYTNSEHGIRLTYPFGWQLVPADESSETIATFVPQSNKSASVSNEVIVATKNIKKSISLDEYTTATVYDIIRILPRAKILDSKVITLDNNPAHRIVYTAEEERDMMKYLQVWLLKNDRAYTITYKAQEDSYNDFLKPVQNVILKSLEIEKLESVTQ